MLVKQKNLLFLFRDRITSYKEIFIYIAWIKPSYYVILYPVDADPRESNPLTDVASVMTYAENCKCYQSTK